MKNTAKIFLSGLLLVMPAVTLAGGYALPAFAKTVMDNGLTVILKGHRTAPTVSVQMYCRTGSIYEQEKRDEGLIGLLDKAIMLLETTGSLDALPPDDHATLMAHTCTSGSESELYSR